MLSHINGFNSVMTPQSLPRFRFVVNILFSFQGTSYLFFCYLLIDIGK